jgi:hypothetical protein
MKNFIKILIIIVSFQFGSQVLFAVDSPDFITEYYCSNGYVNTTIVTDSDKDGVYDTYTIMWCNTDSQTFPIRAIGDIRKWPPLGIPTREIVMVDQNAGVFSECYSNFTTRTVINWFIKYPEIDTVYFYDDDYQMSFLTDVDNYTSNNISFNISPNPASNNINFEYKVNKPGWVKILLYNEIGVIVDVIKEKYQESGLHNFIYNTNNINSGKYFITVRISENEIFTRQITIIK